MLEKIRFGVEVLILFVTICIACIYKGQLDAMLNANKQTQQLVEISRRSSRPFVGAAQIDVAHAYIDKNGEPQLVLHPTPKTIALKGDITVKNFGPLPATDYIAEVHRFVDSTERQRQTFGQAPITLNPGETKHNSIDVLQPDYAGIADGSRIYTIEFKFSYKDPDGNTHNECQGFRYVKDFNAFASINCTH